MADPTWQEALNWLKLAGTMPALRLSSLLDFAAALQNGEILCLTANRLSAFACPQIHHDPRQQFQCFQNINAFLAACLSVFDLDEEGLFDPEELFSASDFQKVISTLSKLSCHSTAKAAGLIPFPSTHQASLPSLPTEDIYGTLATAMQAQIDQKSAPATSPTTTQDYEALSGALEEDIYGAVIKQQRKVQVPSASQVDDKFELIKAELVETEKSYLEVLETILKCFKEPLSLLVHQPNPPITQREMDLLFDHLAEMAALHAELLSIWTRGSVEQISKSFLEHRDRFLVYAEYFVGQEQALDLLDDLAKRREVEQALQRMVSFSEQRFALKDLLTVPVQRFLKYSLLLNELKKRVPPGMAVGSLPDAVKRVQDLAKHINECKRDADNVALIDDIQKSLRDYTPGEHGCVPLVEYGRYLLDGDAKIKLESDGKSYKRYVFLFQRALLVCKPKYAGYALLYFMPINDFSLEEDWSKGRHLGIKLIGKLPSAILFNCALIFKSEATRLKWRDALATAQADLGGSAAGSAHRFLLTSFTSGTRCDQCDFLLWGVFYQGLQCKHCKFASHRHCAQSVDPRCLHREHSVRLQSRRTTTHGPPPASDGTLRVDPTMRPRRTMPSASRSIEPAIDAAFAVGEVVQTIHSFLNHKDKKAGDLDFQKGQQIRILEVSAGHWWLGELVDSGVKGMFPVSFVGKLQSRRSTHAHHPAATRPPATAPTTLRSQTISEKPPPRPPKNLPKHAPANRFWYAGTLDRREAESKLLLAHSGAFLVRAASPGNYRVAVKTGDAVRHLRIYIDKTNYMLGTTHVFPSIPDLVAYFQTQSLSVHFQDVDVTLLQPCGDREFPLEPKCKALFAFVPSNAEEIALHIGDVITILATDKEEGWWEGQKSTGERGLFPKNYVEML